MSAEDMFNYNAEIRYWLPQYDEAAAEIYPECGTDCNVTEHVFSLARTYDHITQVFVSTGNKCISRHPTAHPRSIPGWNVAVRTEYVAARSAFLRWRAGGSPRTGAFLRCPCRVPRLNTLYDAAKGIVKWCPPINWVRPSTINQIT